MLYCLRYIHFIHSERWSLHIFALMRWVYLWCSNYNQLGYCKVSVCGVVVVDSSWNVMAHGDAREGKWRGNWRMEWVANTLHTTSEHGVSSITTADAHTSTASSGLNRRPRRFKWTPPLRRNTKSGFCACAITFQTRSTAFLYKINMALCLRTEAEKQHGAYTPVSNRHEAVVFVWHILQLRLTFKHRTKSHLPFAGNIRSSPYSTRFQDKG